MGFSVTLTRSTIVAKISLQRRALRFNFVSYAARASVSRMAKEGLPVDAALRSNLLPFLAVVFRLSVAINPAVFAFPCLGRYLPKDAR